MMSRPRRSVLYVPGDKPRALAKAKTLACDCVILDLEDSVAPGAKGIARAALADFSAEALPETERVVRINASEPEWAADDLDRIIECRPDAVLVPKVRSADELRAVADRLSTLR